MQSTGCDRGVRSRFFLHGEKTNSEQSNPRAKIRFLARMYPFAATHVTISIDYLIAVRRGNRAKHNAKQMR